MSKHPIQPVDNVGGVLRFRENKIVRFLLDSGPYDLNKLATMPFDQGDWEQLAQLIGYSLSGISELPYVSKDMIDAADRMVETGETELQARLANANETIEKTREILRQIIPELFRIHPDDLET